jgi:hypothetical protein
MISIIVRTGWTDGTACLWWSHHLRVLHVDRHTPLAPRRPRSFRTALFLVMDGRWRAGRQYQSANGRGCGGSDLSVPEPRRGRMEIDRTTGADQLDVMPSWWSTAVVHLRGLLRRPLLWVPSRGPLLCRRAVCLSPVLWPGLCKPARDIDAQGDRPGERKIRMRLGGARTCLSRSRKSQNRCIGAPICGCERERRLQSTSQMC